MKDALSTYLDGQPVEKQKLESIDRKIESGDIHAQYLLPLQEKIKTEVAKLTPEQRREVMPTLKSIKHNTKHQLARLGLKEDMARSAANDDIYSKVA